MSTPLNNLIERRNTVNGNGGLKTSLASLGVKKPEQQDQNYNQQKPVQQDQNYNQQKSVQQDQQNIKSNVNTEQNITNNIKGNDVKMAILIFLAILLLSAAAFYGISKYVSPETDSKYSLLGSVGAAVIGTLIFILYKVFNKPNIDNVDTSSS